MNIHPSRRLPPSIAKYRRILLHSAKHQLTYLHAALLSCLLYALILFIFFSIWKAAYSKRSLIAGFSMVQCLWYLSFSQSLEFSRYRILGDIQNEVKDGTVAYTLARPYSYPLYQFFRAYGGSLVFLIPILTAGFILSSLFAGPLPNYWRSLPFGLLLLLLGQALNLGRFIIIGLTAFWLEESTPIAWIAQKLNFILGGLLIPIDFYPRALARISRLSPFAFSTYWPARTMVDFSWMTFLTALLGQIVYLALTALICAGIYRAAGRRIEVQGG